MLPAPAGPLAADQIARFWRDGFLVVERLLDPASLAQLRELCDAAMRGELQLGADDRRLGGLIRQIMNPARHHRGFVEHPAMATSLAMGRQLLGRAVMLPFDMIITKEPGDLDETPWHQDWSYSERPLAPTGTPIPNKKLQFWVALDDVDVDNGCMRFLPGEHRGLLREHVVAAGDPADDSRLLALREVDPRGAVACPLTAGGCTIHVEGTPHFTGGNRTRDRRRRAYIFNLIPT